MSMCLHVCVLYSHECMCVCTVTVCACVHGGVWSPCAQVHVCMSVWAVHAHTHVWTSAGLQEAWTFLQCKGCENVMVSMATLASLAPGRALPCFSGIVSLAPLTPQAPRPPLPFWGPLSLLGVPLREPELLLRPRFLPSPTRTNVPRLLAPSLLPPVLKSHSASPCGR